MFFRLKSIKNTITALLFALLFLNAYSQEKFGNPDETEKSKHSSPFFGDAQLAMSTPDYPVTAGDVYTLSFVLGNSPFTYTIPLDSTYKIRVANLGVLNCKGLTFKELKNQVLLLVTKNYPMSGAQFVLSSSSNFFVSVTGEVQKSSEQKVWALTRLSDVVSENLTEYSSIRNIKIISESNDEKTYDIFKAERTGDFSQNPYLRPNDKIVINRLYKKVTINGAVERSGTYELLEGENFDTLVRFYGNGLTEYADTTRMILTRFKNTTDKSGETIYLPSEKTHLITLENGDIISIPSKRDLDFTLFFEGAVYTNEENPSNSAINRIPISFIHGENMATLVRRNSSVFFPQADLKNAYLIRNNEKIPLNLEDFLYKRETMSDLYATEDDVIFIPYMQTTSTAFICGEVKESREIQAWPMKRLSELIESHLTEFSSRRNIQVTGIDGKSTSYDLFLASRFGKIEQNPYIRPGEQITIQRISRKVTIKGAVERSGTYELLEGENLQQLIFYYANGLAPLADTSRIELFRAITEKDDSGEKLYLSKSDIENDFELSCYDEVTISSFKELTPTIFVEGAVNTGASANASMSNRIAASVNNGEDYAFFARRNKAWFSSISDLENAYIIRGGDIIPINLSKVLYDASFYSKIEIMADDVLRIPFKQFFVSVSGAVNAPGRYPFIPDRKWDYYVALAGGIIKSQNSRDSLEITALNGDSLSKNDIILPESIIDVKTNSTLYYFNQYAPILTTIFSLVATSLSILVISGAL